MRIASAIVCTRTRSVCLLFLASVLLLIASHSSAVAALSNVPNTDELADYDDDYELLDDSEPQVHAVSNDQSPVSPTDDGVVEMSTSQCSTRDRTRICDCGFLNRVGAPLSLDNNTPPDIQSVTHPPLTISTFQYRTHHRRFAFHMYLGLYGAHLFGQHAPADHPQLQAHYRPRKHVR